MSQLVDNDMLVQQAYQEFQRFTSDAEMREYARRRQRFLDDQKIYTSAARDEGKIEGKAEEKAEIARNLKNMGIGVEVIVTATGLSVDEIERLN